MTEAVIQRRVGSTAKPAPQVRRRLRRRADLITIARREEPSLFIRAEWIAGCTGLEADRAFAFFGIQGHEWEEFE